MSLVETQKTADTAWAIRIKNAVSFAGGDYADRIQEEIDRYEKEKITIAVVGLMKRGKSTFCNAFLNRDDDDLAPIGKLPATGIISKYCSHISRRDAEVRFLDGETKVIPYSEIRNYVTEDNNPENKKNVEFVTVYGNFGFDEDVELMDMPGEGSIHAYHTDIVYRYLPQADVIIFLSSAQDPVQMDELALLRKVEKERNNIFFVMNKTDKCEEEEIADAEEQDRRVLENAKIHVRDIYKISAKEALEGNESPAYQKLLEDIQSFLKANKIDLLRGVFVKRILMIAAPVLGMLESKTALKKLDLDDLEKILEQWNRDSEAMKEKAEEITSSFEAHWTQMVDEFSAVLPVAEENVQSRVENTIKNFPMLAFTKKKLDELPEIISSIIEDELSKPTQAFEDQVRKELERVNTDFPSIAKYMSDENYRISLQKQLGYGVGSTIVGGMLFSTNWALGGSIASIVSSLSGLTIGPFSIGGLGSVVAVVAFPLTALAVIGMVGGALFMSLPAWGWIRGKNQQKKQVIDSARASIENAFRSMRLQKIPELRRKSAEFINVLNARFEQDRSVVEKNIKEAIQKKKNLGLEVNTEEFKKDETHFLELRDLLEVGDRILVSLNRNHLELTSNER